ncbi:MAG TPA: aminoglycoside phosphotransferase family protein [Solirubrobacteraceae bacterium]|nr:aminoglycoside phosphotransferase family protein [Solirubrobacteraceae bacterium]
MNVPHRLSSEFVLGVQRAHPDAGQAWLDALPSLQHRLASRWSLRLRDWLPSRGACVIRAVTVKDEFVIVKIPVIPADTISERLVLEYWGGDGAARLLGADAASGALLIQWVDGRPFVEEVDATRSLRRAADCLRELHRPRRANPPNLPTLEEKLAPWRRSRERQERASRDASAREASRRGREAAVRGWLADSPECGGGAVIHGDLHPRNLLVRRDGSLVAIDPYGVRGDPSRDGASLALFFREDTKAIYRLDALSEYAELDRVRVAAHAYLLAVGAYRFRTAYDVLTGRPFLEDVIGDLERRLAGFIVRDV